MKALMCGSCGDIQALQREWRTCVCGIVSAHWTDPQRGLAEFWTRPHERRYAFLLGLNNQVLVPALRGELALFQDFRAAHEIATNAPGYVFDKSKAACWAAPVRAGTTSDVTFAESDPRRS